jgi:DNA-directed RNA polymerase specialized sigma24 family protein
MKWNYSSTEQCESLFASSAERLRWLCFTLTANEELADRAFESALQQSLKGASRVFQQWMASWARRQIIKSCIAIMRPAVLRVAHCACSCHGMETVSADVIQADILPNLSPSALQLSLMRLDVLSRFVFVLRALEGYSRRDTALLLNLRDADCEAIYSQAAHRLLLDATASQSAEETAISVNEEVGQLEYSVVAGSWRSEQLAVAV